MHRKTIILALALMAVLGVAGAAADAAQSTTPNPAVLAKISARAALDLADAWGMEAGTNGVREWTTSRAIHFVFANGEKVDVALPADLFIASVAPYIMKTHPCKDHFPSTCRGEQVNTPLRVKAVTADGTTIIDSATETLPNGFIDLLLPRNEKIEVTIEAAGLVAKALIGTSDADQTCITTMQLSYGK